MPYGFPVVGEQGNVFPIQFLFDGPVGGGEFDLTAFVDTGADGAHWVSERSDLFTDDGTTAAGAADNVKQINDLSTFGRNLTTLDNTTRGTYDATNRRIGLDGVDDFYFHNTGAAWPGGAYIAWISFTTLDAIETFLRALGVLKTDSSIDFVINRSVFMVDGNDDASVRAFYAEEISESSSPFSPGDTINIVLAYDGTELQIFVNGVIIDTIVADDPTVNPAEIVIGAEATDGVGSDGGKPGDLSDSNSRLQLYEAGYRIGSWTTAQRDNLIAHLTTQGYGS